jgi:hypothetical protein
MREHVHQPKECSETLEASIRALRAQAEVLARSQGATIACLIIRL